MALRSHGMESMKLPGDQSWRDESLRCPPGSSVYSSFYFTEPSMSPSGSHLYGPFFQAPPLPHGPSPIPSSMPQLAANSCYPNGNSSFMTAISNNGNYGKCPQAWHDSGHYTDSGRYTNRASLSPFTPYTEEIPHSNERLQPLYEEQVYEHNSAKYKNLHSGRDSKKIDPCGPFKCKWINCRYPGLFARKSVLMRHIETQHVTPRSFECPDKKCERSFNRKDNMEEHWRRVH